MDHLLNCDADGPEADNEAPKPLCFSSRRCPLEPSLFESPTRLEWIVLCRLGLATLAGAAIGWNRHRAGKPAGIGTHALVALGAALFAGLPILAGHADALSRAIQGVATGVGFLGAGEIFRDPGAGKITGLTSAAALWVTAALGVTIAAGSVFGSLTAAALVLVVLEVAPRLEGNVPGQPPR